MRLYQIKMLLILIPDQNIAKFCCRSGIIAIQQKDKQIGAKRLIVLSASLSDSEREVGESKGRGQRPQSLCVFCTVVILFKLFLDCYSLLVLCQYKKGLV